MILYIYIQVRPTSVEGQTKEATGQSHVPVILELKVLKFSVEMPRLSTRLLDTQFQLYVLNMYSRSISFDHRII